MYITVEREKVRVVVVGVEGERRKGRDNWSAKARRRRLFLFFSIFFDYFARPFSSHFFNFLLQY